MTLPDRHRVTCGAALVALLLGLFTVAPPTSVAAVGGAPARAGAASDAEDPAPVTFTTAPSIAGVERVGRRLTADPGTTDPTNATFSYQWRRAGAPVDGATARTYRLSAADLGKRLAVAVTATADGWEPTTVRSDPTGAIEKGRTWISNPPRVRGWTKVGKTLTAWPHTGAVSPTPRGVTIAWIVGNRELRARRNDRQVEMRPWMRGKTVRVRFVYHPPAGYERLERVVRKRRVSPEGKPVSYPAAAPRPRWIEPNRRGGGPGANRRVTRIPDRVWRSMTGRSWRRGCPVGRPKLRLVRVNYWDYRGDKRRGTVVVHRDIARRTAAALAEMYREKYPIHRMYRVDRFGWSKRLQGANDYASMRAGNTSAFNCRWVVGRPGVRSPHSYGRAVDVNPWENPYYSQQDGWVPNQWWVSRSHPRIAWRSSGHPVIQIWRSHGFRWTYGTSDAHHVDGRVVSRSGSGSFVAE